MDVKRRVAIIGLAAAMPLAYFSPALNSAAAQQNNPLADFKLLGEQTACSVQRLMESAVKSKVTEEAAAEDNTVTLSDQEATAAYECLRETLATVYHRSKHPVAASYSSWMRFSTSPYRSATHGHRYVSNYANPIAEQSYGRYEQAERLPVGSMLAKDSFYVDDKGRVFVGALALMEKMPRGYNPGFNDWRYTLILADGTVFTSRGGLPSPSVKFCGDCHQEVGIKDSLFFMPEHYRRQFP